MAKKKGKKKGKKVAKKKGKKKGKKRGRGRSKKGGKTPRQKGISGRIGAFILGVVPPLLSGIEASSAAQAAKKTHALNMLSTVDYGLRRWMNNLTHGFFGQKAFKGGVFQNVNGNPVSVDVGAGIDKGALWLVAGTGVLMMTYDAIAAKLAGGSATKIPMTNINATGSS